MKRAFSENGVRGREEFSGRRAALRGASLVKRFGEVTAVAGVEVVVFSGECFGLLGPNGAGKTTTVEMLEGLTIPDEGTVEVLGERWGGGKDRALRERLGVQLQETQLSEKLTVEETVRLFRSFYSRGKAPEAVLRLVGLEEKRKARVGKLSGGQKQRLALACALLSDPEILFLDEPTTGLDPQARVRLWDVIEEFHAGGGTIILTTHYMEEAARLCERVAIMDHGRIIAEGSPLELVSGLQADQIVEFRSADRLEEEGLARLPGVTGIKRLNGAFHLSVSSVPQVLPALFAELARQGASLESLATHEPTLEDVFLRLTGRGLRDE